MCILANSTDDDKYHNVNVKLCKCQAIFEKPIVILKDSYAERQMKALQFYGGPCTVL